MVPFHRYLCRFSSAVAVAAALLVTGPSRPPADDPPGPQIPQWTEGTLRVLLRPGSLGHFLFRGQEMGFEHDLLAAFAREQRKKLAIVIPPSGDDVIPWLRAGLGDVAAGISPHEVEGIRFATPHLRLTPRLVTRSDGPRIRSLEDVAGREVAVRRHSEQYAALRALNRHLTRPARIRPIVARGERDSPVIALLEGRADAAIADDPRLSLEAALHPGTLRLGPPVGPGRDVAWAVRAQDEALLQAINRFHARAGRNGLRKIIYEKYFVHNRRLRGAAEEPDFTPVSGRLSRYDDLIARHARRAGFDWRLIAALIFEESRFDQGRVSPAGASGLMQILPIAAREVGVHSFSAPAENIRAGVSYLERLAMLFSDVQPPDRLPFVLAAYNVGPGHVRDAQDLAVELGLDPRRWRGSLDRVLPLLEKPSFYRRTRLGYARGRGVVAYVERVLRRYALYAQYVSREGPAKGAAGPAL